MKTMDSEALSKHYGVHVRPQAEQIAERRLSFASLYRRIYDKAVEGKSLRAAINAQCLDCCASQRDEITLCTDLACPLYAVRPYRISQSTP